MIYFMCRDCADGAKDSFSVRELPPESGKIEKQICAICGGKKYGSKYEVMSK